MIACIINVIGRCRPLKGPCMYILLAVQIEWPVNRCVWLKHHVLSHWIWTPGLLLHRQAVKHLFWPISSCQINSNVWSNRPGRPGGGRGNRGNRGNRRWLRFCPSLNSVRAAASHPSSAVYVHPVSEPFARQHSKLNIRLDLCSCPVAIWGAVNFLSL